MKHILMFSIAAVTIYNKCTGLEQDICYLNFFVAQTFCKGFTVLKSRYEQAVTFQEALGGNPLFSLFWIIYSPFFILKAKVFISVFLLLLSLFYL